MKRIALFASGSGTNVENIIRYFSESKKVIITRVFCNNKNAAVIERTQKLGAEVELFTKEEFNNSDRIFELLKRDKTDLIVLAGFLLLIPDNITFGFENRMINVHPSLLPKYGGKGMYGDNVHKAVVSNKEAESGITIHYVDQHYDEGKIITQVKCSVLPTDTYADVAEKVHALEYEYYPKVIEQVLENI